MNTFFKNRIIILTLNIVVCIVAAWVLFFFIRNIFDKQKQVGDIKSRIEMLKNNSEIIKNQTKKLGILTERQEKLLGLILTKESTPSFFSELENIAEKNNTKITISSVSDIVKNNSKTLSMDIHLVGGLSDIQNFYKALQSMPVQIRINSVLIARDMDAVPVINKKVSTTPSVWQSQASLIVLSY